jgi:hypothetical protein
MKRHSFTFALVLLMALLAAVPATSSTEASRLAQASTVTKDTVSTSVGKNQVPRIAIASSQLYVTWKYGPPPRSVTGFSQRSEAPGPWPAQESIGGASDGTYNTSSVAISPKDGAVHLVWSDFTAGARGQLFHSRKQSNGQWTTPVRVSTGATFVHYPHLTVDTNGRVWAIWSAENPTGNANIYYRYSEDNGVTWKPGSDGLLDSSNADTPWIAADRNGGVHATWSRKEGGVYYGRWNGSRWDLQGIPSGGYNAASSITIDPSNNIHIVWRRQAGFAIWDVYYATKAVGGSSFNIQKLYAGDNINYTVVIYADDQGTLHLTWFDSPKGGEVWYSNKPANGVWLSPAVNVTNDSRFNVNADVVGNSSGNIRAHVVYQTFYSGDSDVRVEHSQIGSVATVVGPTATPSLDGGAVATRNSVVTVNFSNVTGSPDGVRYHWDAAPTDADPWVAFTNPLLNVPGPTGVTPDACQTHTLYTQVRKGTATGSVAQDSEIFDIGVQANVNILNRHLAGLPTVYGMSVNDVFTEPGGNGASDGDPNYTRERSFFLGINGNADCSGLSTFNVTGSDNGPITNNSYANTPALPGGIAFGPHDINVEVKDKLGNTKTEQKTLIYDPANTDATGIITNANTLGLPVLGSGGSVTADNANSIIRSLSFQNITVTDNLYGQQPNLPQLAAGKQFWGVWIANTTSLTITADDQSLNWYPVRVPTPDSSFTVKWNLFTGLGFTTDLRNKPGDYYVFVRFLDGAGNASTGSLPRLKVTLEAGYDIPTMRLPVLTR